MCLWWEVASGGLPPQAERLFTGFQDAVRLALQLLLQSLPQAQNSPLRAFFRAQGLSGPRLTANGWAVHYPAGSSIRTPAAPKKPPQRGRCLSPGSLHISAITILELGIGILQLERKDPRQGTVLRTWLDTLVLPAFNGRIFPVNTAVAQRCARLHVPAPHAERDALIAATALVHGMTVVTRNVADFEATGVPLLNPWDTSQ